MKARYLTYFSYIGTHFRSSEKIWLKPGSNYPDPESIQGLMELALLKLRSVNYPKLTLSSRTDGGVHALQASAHFDLDRFGSRIYDPDNLTYEFNKFFYKTNKSVFVKKCIRVPDNFHARYQALSRTYLYRLAVIKEDVVLPDNSMLVSYIPIEEWKRCHFIRLKGFDINKFKEGAKYLVGYHDFTTFKRSDKLKQFKHSRRQISSFEVTPGHPIQTSYSSVQENIFDFWDIQIKGRAFVHNQIRRMIGALLSVGVGKLPPEEIKVMLQVPSKHSWYSFIQSGPPDGLYLCNVEYDPKDLIYNPEEDSNTEKIYDNDSENED